MLKTKLLQVFYTLSKSQQRHFKKFVHSPIYNTRHDVIQLFEYLYKHHLEQRDLLNRKVAFRVIYPKQTYDEKQMYYLISFLMKSLEDFLIYEERQLDGLSKKLQLAKAYRRLKLNDLFQHTFSHIQKKRTQTSIRDITYLELSYQLEQEWYQFLKEQDRNSVNNLQEVTHTLDISFIASKLQQACTLLASKAVSKTEYQTGLLDKILEYIGQTPSILEHITIALYYHYYRAVNENSKEQFAFFKEKLNNATALFSKEELRNFYVLALNYNVKNLNKGGDLYYAQNALEIYKIGLDNQILLDKDKLSHFSFINIVSIALRLKEYDWSTNFIQQYQKFLQPNIRDIYVNYSLAKLAFEKKDYKIALQYLQKMDYDDLLLNCSAKIIMIKIYYETKEINALESLLSSFRTYINRKKRLNNTYKKSFLSFIKYTEKLLFLNPYSKKEKMAFYKELENQQNFGERQWILKQLNKF